MSQTTNYFIDLMNLKDYLNSNQVVNFLLDLQLMARENNVTVDQIIKDLCADTVEVI